MSDRSLTLLEIHLGDARIQLGSKTLDVSSDDEAAEPPDSDVDEDESEHAGSSRSGRTIGAGLLVVLVVVALAAIAWKVLGETDLDAADELDALDD
ncbi:hypothetical protein [Halorubrum sp. DTA98]|uniref:hypothetical protein n=1 Tax=Halorubrum sp. DTA98 TaxID=3402163 RepID=UPI003AAA32D2